VELFFDVGGDMGVAGKSGTESCSRLFHQFMRMHVYCLVYV